MTQPIVFLDTETDGLHPQRRAWEIAAIRRDDTGTTEYHWFLPLDLRHASPAALQIGGFWDRHPMGRKVSGKPDVPTEPVTTAHDAARDVMRVTFGATIIGVNPAFDVQILERLLRAEGYLPQWHYQIVDCKAMAAGWLMGQPVSEGGWASSTVLPWSSDNLSLDCGIQPPDEDRHTAMGDARWAMRWFLSMTGEAVAS